MSEMEYRTGEAKRILPKGNSSAEIKQSLKKIIGGDSFNDWLDFERENWYGSLSSKNGMREVVWVDGQWWLLMHESKDERVAEIWKVDSEKVRYAFAFHNGATSLESLFGSKLLDLK